MKKLTIKAIGSLFVAVSLAFVALVGPLAPTALAQSCEEGTATIQNGINCAQGEGTPATLFGPGSIFNTIVNVLLFVIGAISVVMLIVGGIRYTTSAGDSSNVTAAKNTILYAIVGLVVAFLAYAIVNWVLTAVYPGA